MTAFRLKHPRLAYAGRLILLFLAYFLTAKFGLKFDAVAGFATLVWPPTGIAIASLLLYGIDLWPAVFIAAFAVNFTTGAAVPVAVGIGLGNTLEAALAAWLLLRDGRFRTTLENPRSVLSFLGLAAALSTLVSSSIGTASLLLGHVITTSGVVETWQAWWLGDLFGAIAVSPLMLVWLGRDNRVLRKVTRGQAYEIAALAVTAVVVGVLVSGGIGANFVTPTVAAYLLLLPLVWAGVSFGLRGSTVMIFGFSTATIVATSMGHGPFTTPPLHDSLASLQLLIGSGSIVSLFLGSAHDERLRADAAKAELRRELDVQERTAQSVFEIAPVGIKYLDRDSRLLMINPAGLAMIGADDARQAIGTRMTDLIAETDKAIFMDMLGRVFDGGTGEMRHAIVNLKGERRVFDAKVVPLREADGSVSAALAAFHDVTREVQQAEQLNARNKELEELNKLMVGRELTMVELKKNLKNLRQGQ